MQPPPPQPWPRTLLVRSSRSPFRSTTAPSVPPSPSRSSVGVVVVWLSVVGLWWWWSVVVCDWFMVVVVCGCL